MSSIQQQQQQQKKVIVTNPYQQKQQVTTTTTTTTAAPAPAAPTKRVQKNPNDDIVQFTIKLPRIYYNLFSQFAKFLNSQPAQDPNTGQPIIDPHTGKGVAALPDPTIQTYMVTCALNTYQSYQMVMQMVKQRQAQQQQQPPQQ